MDQENKNNEVIDLSDALKDSDMDVKFQDEWYQSVQTFRPGTPKIIQWVIKYSGGLVKNEKQANYVLLGFVAVTVIISLFLIFGGSNQQHQIQRNINPETGEEIIPGQIPGGI